MVTENKNPFDLPEDIKQAIGVAEAEPLAFVPTIPKMDFDLAVAEATQTDREAGFLTGFSLASQEEHIHSLIGRNTYRFSSTPLQPVEELTPDVVKFLSEGLDYQPEAIKQVLQAAKDVSLEYASKMADDYRVTANNARELANAGWDAKAGYLAGAMLDPTELAAIGATSLAVGAMSGPAAPVTAASVAAAGGARKAYSVWRGAKTAFALGAVEAGAFESIRDRLKYDVDGGDVLLAMFMGGTLGSGFTATSRAFAKNKKLHVIKRKLAMNEAISPEERAFFDEFGGDRQVEKLVDEAEARGDFADPEDKPDIDTLFDEPFSEAEAARTTKQLGFGAGIRGKLSSFVRAKNSDNMYVRLGADLLGLNSTGNRAGVDGNRDAVNFSASEIKSMLEFRFRTAFAQSMHYNRKDWTRRTGRNQNEFNVLVSRAIRSGDFDNLDTEVANVAKHVKESETKLGEMAIKYDVAGFTPSILKTHDNYLPRLFNQDKLQGFVKTHGSQKAEDLITDLVETAIRNAQPETKMTDKQIKAMARGYTQNIINPSFHSGHRANELTEEDMLTAIMNQGFIEEDARDIINALSARKKVKGHKRSRPRVVLDENASIEIQTANGVETLRFSDLLEEDIENLHNAYIFQMSGAIGLARNGIGTNKPSSTFDNLIAKIEKQAGDIGQDRKALDAEIKALEFMYDGITGRLGFEKTGAPVGVKQFNRKAREYSFINTMGMSGMSAIMEINNALFEHSFRTLFKTLPQLRKFTKRARDGQLDSAILRELEAFTGLGADTITGKFTRTTRFEGDSMELAEGTYSKYDELLAHGRERMAFLSGLSGITGSLRRLSMLNYAQSWATAAKGGKLPFKQIKMEQLGISTRRVDGKPSMAERISAQLNQHADVQDGTLQTLNTKDWDDKEAKDIFEMSVFRDATQSVQEVNIGSSNRFMRSEVGKTALQFMTYTLGAVEQQTMRMAVRLRHGDAGTVSKIFLGSTLTGAMLYTLRVYLNAAGRGDREEYIDKMLSPERLMIGSLSQIGMTAIAGYVFDIINQSSSHNTNALTPPIFGLAGNFLSGVRGLGEAGLTGLGVMDNELSEGELRSFLRAFPFASLYGVRQLFNYISDQLTDTN